MWNLQSRSTDIYIFQNEIFQIFDIVVCSGLTFFLLCTKITNPEIECLLLINFLLVKYQIYINTNWYFDLNYLYNLKEILVYTYLKGNITSKNVNVFL